jgi:hypothetical protein
MSQQVAGQPAVPQARSKPRFFIAATVLPSLTRRV